MGGLDSPFLGFTKVRDAIRDWVQVDAELVDGGTARIASLTSGLMPPGSPHADDDPPYPGDKDLTGLPHPNCTIPWCVPGVDMGANTDHGGTLFIFFGDVPPSNGDLIAYSSDVCPEPDGIHLTPVASSIPNDKCPTPFIPYKIRFSPFSEPHIIGSDQTPTGAFSYDGYLYVFAFGREDQNNPTTAASYLTRSQYPFDSSVYDLVFTASPENGKFFQVAPHVIRNEELKGLPAENGDGLIMFGYGQEHVYLAWMPLTPGRVPALEDMRYFNNGNWLANESDAAPLFEKTAWTSLSVGRIKETGLWILLSQTGTTATPPFGPDVSNDGQIRGRIAATPWDIASADKIVLFDKQRDDPDASFMLPGSFAYGAYLLNRYTLWDEIEQTVTIYYLMSPSAPYQVQLMRSTIRVRAGLPKPLEKTLHDLRGLSR